MPASFRAFCNEEAFLCDTVTVYLFSSERTEIYACLMSIVDSFDFGQVTVRRTYLWCGTDNIFKPICQVAR